VEVKHYPPVELVQAFETFTLICGTLAAGQSLRPAPTYAIMKTRTTALAIDFETFVDNGYDIRKLGLDRYVADERFRFCP
jgi:hypothetical protein